MRFTSFCYEHPYTRMEDQNRIPRDDLASFVEGLCDIRAYIII